MYPNGGVSTTNSNGLRMNISTAFNTFSTNILIIGSEGTNYINPTNFPSMSGTTCITITSTTTYYLNVSLSFSGDVRVSTTNAYFRALRIG